MIRTIRIQSTTHFQVSHPDSWAHIRSTHLCSACVCVCIHTYTPISINIYRHVQMSICFDYSAMTPYNPYAPIVICLCVPAYKGLARRLHTCDPMFKGLYSNIHICQCFLWIHTYHVHRKNVHCMQLPLPYMRSSTSSLSGSIPSVSISTWTRAHVCRFRPRLVTPKKKM